MTNKALWIFPNFLETINELPENQRADVWRAICEYGLGCEINITKFKTSQKMAIKMLQPLLKLRNCGGSIKDGEIRNKSGFNQFSSLSDCNSTKVEDKGYPNPKENPKDNPKDNGEENPLITRTRTGTGNRKGYPVEEINKEERLGTPTGLNTEPHPLTPSPLDWVADEYRECFKMWLDYKKSRKESYKNDKSLRICYERLLELSGNNPVLAKEVVRTAIGNNWAGLFALKNSNQQQPAVRVIHPEDELPPRKIS